MSRRKNHNVYKSVRHYESHNTSRIADRMDEASVDLLIRARNQFGLRYINIAHEADFDYQALCRIVNKTRYCRKAEYTIIYNAMIRMILEKLNMTPQEAMQKIRAMEAGNER